MVRVTVRNMVRVRGGIRVSVRVGVADCCIQTARKSDKMRISHVIKTDQWRSVPQIRPAPHFVVSPKCVKCLSAGTDEDAGRVTVTTHRYGRRARLLTAARGRNVQENSASQCYAETTFGIRSQREKVATNRPR